MTRPSLHPADNVRPVVQPAQTPAQKRRERESHTKNYPLIGFRKPDNRKGESAEKAADGESSEPAKAGDPEDAKEVT